MNKNIIKRIICLVIALMMIMPAMPNSYVSADSNGNEKGNSNSSNGNIAGTTTGSAITFKINVDLYNWSGSNQKFVENFTKTFVIEDYDFDKGITLTYDDLLDYGLMKKYNINSSADSKNSMYTQNSTLKSIKIPAGITGEYNCTDYEIHLKDGGSVLWKVVFEDWNHEVLDTQWVINGKNATPPADPERTGYEFDGWDGTYKNVTQDEVVTATYNQNKYTVTFKAGANGSLTGTTVFKDIPHGTSWGEAVTVPTPTAESGYKFAGWTPSSFETSVTKNLEYTANFVSVDVQIHTVTFTAGTYGKLTGTTVYNVLDGAAWGTITVPTPVADPGYKFAGWTPSQFETKITRNLEYKADFVKDEEQWHKVEFIAGANGSLTGKTLYENILHGTSWEDAVTTVPTPTAESGYKFAGWTESTFESTIIKDLVYTANFVAVDVQVHTVTFTAGDNGSLTGTKVYSVLDGAAWGTITVPTPVANPGYKFAGWAPSPFESTITKDLIYTANFVKDDAKWHKVEFKTEANGSLTGTTLFKDILDGAAWGTITVPTPVANPGYKFAGWTPSPFESTITKDLVYTANFVKDNAKWHKVEFEAGSNGSLTGTTLFEDILDGTSWEKAVTVPTPAAKPGYKFAGWTQSTFESTITKDLKYTANFVSVNVQSHKVTFVAGANGSLTGTTLFENVTDGTSWEAAVKVPTPVANAGYIFTGWTPAFAKTITEDLVYTANFEKDESGNNGGDDENNNDNDDDDDYTDITDIGVPLADLEKSDHFAYVIGYPEGDVRPLNNITREEVAMIFYRLLTDESRSNLLSDTNSFTDLENSVWSNRAISTLYNAGILKGYPDGTFRPTEPVTRAEFATIAAKFDKLELGSASKFTDISGHWAEKYITSSEIKGWIKGYNDLTFKPEQDITRAETMTLINNVLERTVPEENIHPEALSWTDIESSDWYYEAVMEATNSHDYLFEEDGDELWTGLKANKVWP
jgi:uncharacterized repeat protein (TIGR02543 family)